MSSLMEVLHAQLVVEKAKRQQTTKTARELENDLCVLRASIAAGYKSDFQNMHDAGYAAAMQDTTLFEFWIEIAWIGHVDASFLKSVFQLHLKTCTS